MSSDLEPNPRERVRIEITSNATLEASRFCVERCGMIGEAQEMALMATAMCAGGVATATWERDNPTTVVTTEGDIPTPQIIMKCKGPRKKHLIFGDLVCRGSARVNTA